MLLPLRKEIAASKYTLNERMLPAISDFSFSVLRPFVTILISYSFRRGSVKLATSSVGHEREQEAVNA
jgi:hypothetical protein